MSASQAILIAPPLVLLLPGGRPFSRHHLVVNGSERALAQGLLEFRLLGGQFGCLLFEGRKARTPI